MKNLMQTLNVPSDMPIENKMISKSIESAQKKVEGNNFDIRKHLVEYDDVINKHRLSIYKLRREILDIAEAPTKEEGARSLSDIILEMVNEEIVSVASFHCAGESISAWNIKEIVETMKTIWTTDETTQSSLEEILKQPGSASDLRLKIIDYLEGQAKDSYLKMSQDFVAVGVEFLEIEKGILIRSIDQMWVDHLEAVDYLRRGIGLRGYGQRDPLVEYKKEAYYLYQELNALIRKQVTYSIYKTGSALTAHQTGLNMFSQAPVNQALSFTGAAKEMQRETDNRNSFDLVVEKTKDEHGDKVGRNDLCPCGSGLKFKKCHGK